MHFFKLRKLGKLCDCCGERLVDKAYSTIDTDEEASRKDLCPQCFNTEKPPIWWRVRVEEKKALPLAMTQYEQRLFDLFSATKEEHWLCFLAHYFKRRKFFFSQGECEKEGKLYEILESKETQDVYLVPKMTPSSQSVREILDGLQDVSTA